jgi:hypothetical protein
LALREWGSSASGSGSSLRRLSPGSLAWRVLPGLFLCAGFLLAAGPASAGPVGRQHPSAALEAAGPQQPPEDTTPAGGGGTSDGDTVGPEEEVFPDTTLFTPQALGPKPAPGDTAKAPADTTAVRADTTGVRVDTTGAAADTTGLRGGPAPAPPDTAGTARPAVGLPQTGLPPTEAEPPGPSGAIGPRPEAKSAARRGFLGLHPAVIILGLVVAHVFLVKLITK